MRLLHEKIEKMQRRLATFKSFLNDDSKKIKYSSYAHELGEDWQSIQKYLNDVTIAFEFECYLETGDQANVSNVSRYLSLIDLRDTPSGNLSFLGNYFEMRENTEAWEMVDAEYYDALYGKAEKEFADFYQPKAAQLKLPFNDLNSLTDEQKEKIILEIQQKLINEYPLDQWLQTTFSNMNHVVHHFSFWPKYGFWSEDNKFIHDNERSEQNDYEDEDYEYDVEEYRKICYKTIKNQIKTVFNAPVSTSPVWHGIDTEFKIGHPSHWFVEYDSSLRKYDNDFSKVAVEIISPQISARNFIKVLSLFKERIYDYFHGETDNNNKIGCHINITFPQELPLNSVKLIIMADADRWATKFNRQFADYAQSQIKRFISVISDMPRSLPFEKIEARLSSAIRQEKMMNINFLKTNVIEFRFPGNEYLEKYYKTLIETVQWLLYAMVVATHEKFHRQEYLYRVGKLVQQTLDQNDEAAKTKTE